MTDERHVGPFRWRGSLNWKDVTERMIAGIFIGIPTAIILLIDRLVG